MGFCTSGCPSRAELTRGALASTHQDEPAGGCRKRQSMGSFPSMQGTRLHCVPVGRGPKTNPAITAFRARAGFFSPHNTTPATVGLACIIPPTPCPWPIHSSASAHRQYTAVHPEIERRLCTSANPATAESRDARMLSALTIASFPARHSPCTNPHSSRTASRRDGLPMPRWSARSGETGSRSRSVEPISMPSESPQSSSPPANDSSPNSGPGLAGTERQTLGGLGQ